MRGSRVIVRTYSGKAALARVWDANSKVVLITTDDGFRKLSSGKGDVLPIGFPKVDVFRYNPRLVPTKRGRVDWAKLEPWEPH